MYHQIKVAENDQDALRFAWKGNTDKEIVDHMMKVHIFGKVDSPALHIGLLKGRRQTNQSSMKTKLLG